ncbi:MAG: hypothetical protein AB1521_04580 [Bacteroidota bacterium]
MEAKLTYSKILKFWLPLLATWLMMSAENPFLTALIARMPAPEYNLAAYGVAFSIALIVESPVIMMMSASIALVEDKFSFIKLRKFVYAINLVLVLLMTLLILDPVYQFIFVKLLNLPMRVAHLTHVAVAILIPWAPSIGYRRFYQGVMIRNNLTRRVAYGTVIRLSAMSLTAFVLFTFSDSHGVVVGAAALSAGVVAEAIATRFMAVKIVDKIKSDKEEGKKISYNEIIKFYYPLVLTSFISLGIHPIVTFFLGQSRMALESLAVLPVLNSLVFIFRAFGLSFQEVGVTLMKNKDDFNSLKNFAAYMTVGVVAGLGLISFTPMSNIWLLKVSGLSTELADFAKLPFMLYTIFPATTVLINFQRALLVSKRNTNPITYATIIEVIGIIVVLTLGIKFLNLIGVVVAILAYTVGRLMANGYLMIPFKKTKNEYFK